MKRLLLLSPRPESMCRFINMEYVFLHSFMNEGRCTVYSTECISQDLFNIWKKEEKYIYPFWVPCATNKCPVRYSAIFFK